MRTAIIVAVLVAALGSAGVARAADDAPKLDGTIELKGGSVGLGIGFSWGSGTLTYKGKEYPITASGFEVGEVGGSDIRATGKVYNMTDISLFDGSYSGFAGGASLVAGGSAVTMSNQNGVRIEMVAASAGVKLLLGGDTIEFKIKK